MLNLNEPPGVEKQDKHEMSQIYVVLQKDNKPICRTKPIKLPFHPQMSIWQITKFHPVEQYRKSDFPQFKLFPEPENPYQEKEWPIFMRYLHDREKVALVSLAGYELYIQAPDARFLHAVVMYRILTPPFIPNPPIHIPEPVHNLTMPTPPACDRNVTGLLEVTDDNAESFRGEVNTSAPLSFFEATNVPKVPFVEKNFISAHPTYLKTLSQTHASWIFGAIAELVDNSRDAKSKRKSLRFLEVETMEDACKETLTYHSKSIRPLVDYNGFLYENKQNSLVKIPDKIRAFFLVAIFKDPTIQIWVEPSFKMKQVQFRLDINIESLYSKKEGKKIPVLSVVDDGHGMSHDEIMTMIAFGHGLPTGQQPDHIGKFGIGFKTGSMRLGEDAVVLTQTSSSRSVALLSRSFNEGQHNLEIPVVSYCKHDNYMEFDLNIQSEASGEYTLKAIKDVSPFNEYFLGEKLGHFGETGTGTQIYIWNLDKWGQNYSLDWDNKEHQGDILIRSKRVRTRHGHLSQEVPLDYSLRTYLELIFLNPRMRIYIQGSLVKARPLAKSLNKTAIVNGIIMGKALQLTLGRSKTEWERFNSGIFLYWHGRLIEAYKRVGSQVYNSDVGRGVLGVVDVTNLMDDDDGNSWVMNSKQGFQDCETYAKLEEWLGKMFDQYWDRNFDTLDLKKGSDRYNPDHQWVQCDKCRKWRVLESDFDTSKLPLDWFCFLPPYLGRCEDPEKQVGHDVITISAKRSGYGEENITGEDHGSPLVGPGKHGRRATVPLSKRHSPASGSSPTTWTTHSATNNISTSDEEFGGTSENIEEPNMTRSLRRLRRGPSRGGKC